MFKGKIYFKLVKTVLHEAKFAHKYELFICSATVAKATIASFKFISQLIVIGIGQTQDDGSNTE